jgi:hypothetical protein
VSRTAKIVYFLAALCIMTCFAAASVMLASNRPLLAAVLFIVAILATGTGFAVKGKLMKP